MGKSGDLIFLAVIASAILILCVLGGVDYPNSIAGSVARFFWSLR